MRALVMRPQRLDIEERPIPMPGPGQVLVKTIACGICGSDLHLFKHADEMQALAREAGISESVLESGIVLGHEFVATIVQFGPDTKKNLSIGSRVTSTPFLKGDFESVTIGSTPLIDGAYAEYFLLTEESLISIPENLPSDAAALTEPLAIGIHAVNKANPESETVAIVFGCGPIGLAVIAALKLRGLKYIIASDFSAKRRELAETMGATVTVNPAENSPTDHIPKERLEHPAVAFECTGASGLLEDIVGHIPPRSEIVVAGIAHGNDSFTPMVAIGKELSFHFVSFYQTVEFQAALDALNSGKVNWKPWITDRIDLDKVCQAFEDLQTPERHAKILIYPNGIT